MKAIMVFSAATLALAAGGAANAVTTFGPATGDVVVLGSPTVVTGPTAGMVSFNSPVSIFSTNGSLTAANGSGSATGTLNFSDTAGTVLPDVVANFMTFNDTTGGHFFFNVASAQTIAYSMTASSTSITLYLLGTAGDSNLGLTAAPTSETLTINRTGNSAYSASASINAPPTGAVPEPASWALMLVGFGAAGMVLRRSRKPVRNLTVSG